MNLQGVINAQVDGGVGQSFWLAADKLGYSHERSDLWPAAPGASALHGDGDVIASAVGARESKAVFQFEAALAVVTVIGGSIYVSTCGESPAAARECIRQLREMFPPYESADRGLVPVTFWTATPHGGRSIRRDIDAPEWDAIDVNYPGAERLCEMMSPVFRPGVGGQLILWHGEPGTGKTTALRALARSWREWCDLHYIVDPEVFFGNRSDYMMEVLTATDIIEYKSDSQPAPERWRMLVLEDCGELLQPDAKREVGQALARLLNACDGLIGRGLRILVLLTTNEPAEKLHEAVARPGRCAARIEFAPFAPSQARGWLADHGATDVPIPRAGLTLADLYGEISGFRERRRERAVGFAA